MTTLLDFNHLGMFSFKQMLLKGSLKDIELNKKAWRKKK